MPWFRRQSIAHSLGVCGAGLVLCNSAALAQEAPRLPVWEAGVAVLSIDQAAYPGSASQAQALWPLPYFVYRGPWLKADRSGVGLRALKTPTVEVDFSAALTVGLNPSGVRAREGMPRLGTLLQMGPRATWRLGTHAGARWSAQWPLYQVVEFGSSDLRLRGVSTEPELRFDAQVSPKFNWGMSGGALLGDRTLNQLFYGVDAPYATPTRPIYDARAGLIAWRSSVFGGYQVTPDLRLFVSTRWDYLKGAANASSPLAQTQQNVSTTVGLVYLFSKSAELAP